MLEKEYKKLLKTDLSLTGKVNILNNIIQFKINEKEFANFNNDLSVDVKRYLNALVELSEKGARNYDIINEQNLIELLNNFDHDEKITYLDYFIRILEKSAFKDEIKKLQKLKYHSIIIRSLKTIWKPISIYQLIIFFPLYSLNTLIITLIIIGLLANIILLPAPFEFLEVINVKLEFLNFSENKMLNHFVNITSGLIGINGDFKITPLDAKSMILLMVGKIFMFCYVVNLVFNKLTDLIKR